MPALRVLPTLVACALALGACSPSRFVAKRVGGALASGNSTWAEDDDPELVAAALPFALKTLESLLAQAPDDPRLLLANCRGFVSYSAGFVEAEAERIPAAEFEAARGKRERALRLHLRALGYCRRALAASYPEAAAALSTDGERALARLPAASVELLFWTGAAWGSAISLGGERPELIADLPVVRALFDRALALDPGFDRGALHEALIPLESLPPMLGGSEARARARYQEAVSRSGGARASPHVTFARSFAVARQDRAAFRAALEAALAVDPDASAPDRLANRLAQERARGLLARADELFFEEE
jgi:predicted anti-sigma-YlaC factor YlaD